MFRRVELLLDDPPDFWLVLSEDCC